MSTDARIRIENHSLMRAARRAADVDPGSESLLSNIPAHTHTRHHRVVVHALALLLIFVVTFIFTVGLSILGVAIFVRSSDELVRLLAVELFSGAVFVAIFAGLRVVAVQVLLPDTTDSDEHTKSSHQVVRSVVYGVLALIIALLVVSTLFETAFGSTLVQ